MDLCGSCSAGLSPRPVLACRGTLKESYIFWQLLGRGVRGRS